MQVASSKYGGRFGGAFAIASSKMAGGGAAESVESVKATFIQAGHGFVKADGVRYIATGWEKALATNDEVEDGPIGVVESFAGDNFTVVFHGKIDLT